MMCDWNRAHGIAGNRCTATATVIRTVVDDPRSRHDSQRRLPGRPLCDECADACQKMDKKSWRAEYTPIGGKR